MEGRKGRTIDLTEAERAALEEIRSGARTGEREKKRAQVLLELDAREKGKGKTIAEIARENGLSQQAVYMMREAYEERGEIEAYVQRKRREKAPTARKADEEAEEEIVALARSAPPKGYRRWTVRLLAEETERAGIVEEISFMTVQRILKRNGVRLG